MSYVDAVPEAWLTIACGAMEDASKMVERGIDDLTAPIVGALVAFAAEVRALAMETGTAFEIGDDE